MDTSIAKIDEEQRIVFGWASVAKRADGTTIEDSQGDVIESADLEKAAYDFVLDFREANAMHSGPVTGRLVESFVSTPEKLEKMGIPAGVLPTGWWSGYKIEDDDAWAGVKSGRYKMFSIEGVGTRTAI